MRNSILGSTLSFILVFRANNAYMRYCEGKTILTEFFCDLREVVNVSVSFMGGGCRNRGRRWQRQSCGRNGSTTTDETPKLPDPDGLDDLASEERTQIIRWALIMAISLQLHTRALLGLGTGYLGPETKWLIDWDRYRIRHLTTADEFRHLDCYVRSLTHAQKVWDEVSLGDEIEVDQEYFAYGPPYRRGCCRTFCNMLGLNNGVNEPVERSPGVRLPTVVGFYLSSAVSKSMNDNKLQDKPFGFPERCLPTLLGRARKLLGVFTTITQSVSTPLPFPYFHLCRLLLILYFVSFPCFIDHELGLWANVGELSVLSLALLGVDAIATELENPFGDDVNDLDIYEKIAGLEREFMSLLDICCDDVSRKNFKWLDMPEYINNMSHMPISHFLGLTTQADNRGSNSRIFVAEERPKRDMETMNSLTPEFLVPSQDEFESDDSR